MNRRYIRSGRSGLHRSKVGIAVVLTLLLAVASTPVFPAQALEDGEPVQAQTTEVPTEQETSDEVFEQIQPVLSEETPEALDVPDSATRALSVDDISGVCTISAFDGVIDIPGASTETGTEVQLWSANETVAQRFMFIATADGYHTIKNINSGKVLDVCQGSVVEGAVVWQYDDNDTLAQKWVIETDPVGSGGYRICSALDRSYCLGVSDTSAAVGTKVRLYRNNGTPAQNFGIDAVDRSLADGSYVITSVGTRKAVDLARAALSDGTNIHIWSHNDTLAQRFAVAYDTGTGYYSITNVFSGKVLDVAGAGASDSTNVHAYGANGTAAQKWAVTELASGEYRITAAHSGLVLDVSGGVSADGTNIHTYTWNGTGAQRWTFESRQLINEGTFQITGAVGTVLDAAGGGKTDGTDIWAYEANGTLAQKFQVKQAADGHYTFECLNSGLVVTQTAYGSDVILATRSTSDNQQWKPAIAGNGRFYFQNKASGSVLDVAGGSSVSGVNVRVYPLNHTAAQQWGLDATDPVSEGLYVISSAAATSMAVDIIGGSRDDHARVHLYGANGTTAQTFRFAKVGVEHYRITNIASAKALDVENSALDPTTGQGVVQQYSEWGTDNAAQLWRIEYFRNGAFRLFSAVGDGTSCLDISSGVFVDGQPVQVWRANETVAQEFLFSPAGMVGYEPVGMSVDQMVYWQRLGNSYIAGISDQHLRDVIDPASAMSNYYYPGHETTYTGGLYQFADLRTPTGLHPDQINALIESTPAGRTGNLRGLGAAFVSAAHTYNLNECYLLAHAVLESGWGTSQLSAGNYYSGTIPIEGRWYPAGTYYNFYGIGAYDSSPFSGGMSLAVQNDWDTPEKAVLGAARWIAENYVYRSPYAQPTLYAMKWDYARSSVLGAYGWHQYATDHLWARKIARLMGDFYSGVGYTPDPYYIVPQYR